MRSYKLTNFLLITVSLLTLLSCAKDKTHLPARLYHRTTSYFNGYYNAKQLFNETLDELEGQYQFPEGRLIEVINYGDENEIKSYTGSFDEIIEKNDIVIFKHPNGNYVDKCRLLNGKAWFYKQSYDLAMQNFNEVLNKFPDSDLIPEVHFWRAKSFYMMENGEMARSVLEEEVLYNDTIELSKELLAEMAIFRARMARESEDYATATKLLEEQVDNLGKRRRRARTHYLLGQLYDRQKNFPKSLENFQEVIANTNEYDFVFRTKMKIARLYVDYQEGMDDDQLVYEYLTKLLKDEKNEEYRDQILFEFALLEYKKDSLDNSLAYLRESLDVNVGNRRQQALSYYKSGQIYFYDLQDYTNAQAYFDSAATAITETAPEYKEITSLAKTLKEYVTAVETIHYQDSMLWLASLPEDQLTAVIDTLVAQEERRKKEEQEREMQRMLEEQNDLNNLSINSQLGRLGNRTTRQQSQGGGGTWYFDNPAAITNGRLQFQQRWGKRANEDDWRRSNKNVSTRLAGNETDSAAVAEVDSAALEQYGDKYAYYQDIPKTEEDKAVCNQKIEEALYKLGQIYAQNLNEVDSAIKTYEYLLDRYEDSEYTLRARYALYKLYSEQGSPLANVQRNFILNEHPNTVYAYLILGKDPNELKQEEEEYLYAYDGLFAAYYNKEYETSLGFSEFLLQEYTDRGLTEQMARLQYIRGMSYGYTGDKDSLRTILTHVVETYPESEVATPAQQTLDLMNKGFTASKPKEAPGEEEAGGAGKDDPNLPQYEGFSTDVKPNDKIFVLMYIDKNAIPKAEANTKISNFNKQHAKEQKLKVFVFLYKQTHLVPYINRFNSIQDAQKYVTQFKSDPVAEEVLKGEDAAIFYITHSNFKVAYGKKRMTDYIDFYKYILKGQ